MDLKLMLEEAVGQYGDKTIIVSGDHRLSYTDLDEASNKVANTLIEIGVNKGDRVAMLLTNSPEFVISYYGIIKAGAIAVPLDPKYKINELASLFDDSLPRVVVSESPTLEPLVPALSKFKSIRHVIDLNSEYEGRFISYQKIMAISSARRIELALEPEDVAHIAYTSGPTFHPRGIMLSHRCLVSEVAISVEGFQQTEKDVMMSFSLPMHHMLGLIEVVLASVYKGSTVVIVPGTGLSIGSFLAAIEREKGTVFLGVPYTFGLIADMAKEGGIKNDLSSFRLCGSAGAPLSIDILERFKRYCGFDLIDFWGLTEATCHVTCPPIDGTGKRGSVGKALRGCEVKIVDDKGRELPPNQAGEIIFSGSTIMKGYYNNTQATTEVIKDGWLYTGDIGMVDEDGYLFLTDRKKELIIVKGQNIFPSDIEGILYMHPKVAETAVLGIPDERRGEVVGAVISLKERKAATEQEIKQFCLERLANYKVPKQVVFLDSLPRTAAGKVDKESIRRHLSIPSLFPEVVIS